MKQDYQGVVRLVDNEKRPLCLAWRCACGWVSTLDQRKCMGCGSPIEAHDLHESRKEEDA